MRKTFLILIFLLTTSFAFSQQKKKIHFGAQSGINISNIVVRFNNLGISYKASSIVGFNGGFTVEMPVVNKFYVQVEPSFSQLGAKIYPIPYEYYGQFLNNADSGFVTVKSTLSYVTLPVLAKYKLPNTGLGIYLGAQYGILVRAADKVSNSANSALLNAKDDYKKSDFTGIIGAEYYLPMGIGLSARYQHGFSNIQEGTHNRSFAILLGYRL